MWKKALCLFALNYLAVACSDARTFSAPADCFDYNTAIAPVMAASCQDCHGATVAQGRYQVDSYRAILAPDLAGNARVVAGDPNSLALSKASGAAGHPTADAATQAILKKWVVDCRLSFFKDDLVHPESWMDFSNNNPSFHGAAATAPATSSTCAGCHGTASDPIGGSSGLSCLGCHPQGITGCTACHGAPPSDGAHASGWKLTDCHLCHGQIVDASGTIIAPDQHMVGKLFLGDGSQTCTACHGTAGTSLPASGWSAPPKDLNGSTDTGVVTVGMHAAHVGAHLVRGPIPCSDCHASVPTPSASLAFLDAVESPGHIDSILPAKVFPGGSAFTGLGAGGPYEYTSPRFDAASPGTCSNAYCHLNDTSMTWTVASPVTCGTSCHLTPPPDEPGHHVGGKPFNPVYTMQQCHCCHAATMAPGATGSDPDTIIFNNGSSLHIDGTVEFEFPPVCSGL